MIHLKDDLSTLTVPILYLKRSVLYRYARTLYVVVFSKQIYELQLAINLKIIVCHTYIYVIVVALCLMDRSTVPLWSTEIRMWSVTGYSIIFNYNVISLLGYFNFQVHYKWKTPSKVRLYNIVTIISKEQINCYFNNLDENKKVVEHTVFLNNVLGF